MARIAFKKHFHAAILDGTKTTTLRRWRQCRLKKGDRVDAPGVGQLILKAVEQIEWKSLTASDAISDGFASLEALNAAIRKIYPNFDGDGKSWFKVTFRLSPDKTRRKIASRRGPSSDDDKAASRRQLAAAVRAELDKAICRNGS